MKKKIFLTLSFLILIPPAYASQPVAEMRDLELLQGLWRQECAKRNERTEEFIDSTVTLKESFFSDGHCQKAILVFINEGTFVLPAARNIDFRFTSVRLKLGGENLIQDFNHRKVCGFQDWKIDEEKEISGRLCEIFIIGSPQKIPTAGDMRYGTYHLQDDRLQFGKISREENALTPEKRPTKLDPRYYTKSLSGL
jgi:hypothetical protein